MTTDDRATSAVPDLDLDALEQFVVGTMRRGDPLAAGHIRSTALTLVLHARALRAEVAALTATAERYKAALEEIGGWACANPDDLAARVFRLARAALAPEQEG